MRTCLAMAGSSTHPGSHEKVKSSQVRSGINDVDGMDTDECHLMQGLLHTDMLVLPASFLRCVLAAQVCAQSLSFLWLRAQILLPLRRSVLRVRLHPSCFLPVVTAAPCHARARGGHSSAAKATIHLVVLPLLRASRCVQARGCSKVCGCPGQPGGCERTGSLV